MKKWILSAAFFLAMSSFAAAQTTKAREVPKTQKTAVKKGTTKEKTIKKTETKKTETKKANETEVVAALPAKLKVTLPAVDTTGVPVKRKQ